VSSRNKGLQPSGRRLFTSDARPKDCPKLDTVVEFKASARGTIEAQGYKIIANVGDQWSDLNGGHSEQNFKVPNPFYFIK
jgi:hypothetical protein